MSFVNLKVTKIIYWITSKKMLLNKMKDNHPTLILYNIYFYQLERNEKKKIKQIGNIFSFVHNDPNLVSQPSG
jgi:hypothetical protein